ncbi:MAG: DUF3098 domain-containing protein [Muribaculaceae bacterium]|nr:DUF3098 domain-containing protein [Muribaculaceae bacterium]MDE6632480.1 DUF3098 domain-containing protein [Muribaculaceae bacterium]
MKIHLPKPQPGDIKKVEESERPFGKKNYIAMAVCLVLIVLGFILMAGPGSSVEGGFNPDIFSTRRIVIGPAVTFLGFLLMAFAILFKPSK